MNIKNILLISILFLLSVTSVASATTHIAGGTLESTQYLSTADTYILDGDITFSGTPIIFTHNDSILDLNGYNIEFSTTPAYYKHGISSDGYSNLTITNGSINTTSTMSFIDGICIVKGSNIHISNIAISIAGGGRGIYLDNITSSSVSNCICNSTSSYGVFLTYSTNNIFSHVNSSSVSGFGTYLISNSIYNSFDSCVFSSTQSRGIKYDTTSAENTYTNCQTFSSPPKTIHITGGPQNSSILLDNPDNYVLDGDITFPGTGFVCTVDNTSLDLNGHNVNFSTNTGNYKHGFCSDGYLNVIIKNGSISTPNTAQEVNGIYIEDGTNFTIDNISTFIPGNGRGIFITKSNHGNVSNCNHLNSSSGNGLLLTYVNNNTFTHVNASSNSNFGNSLLAIDTNNTFDNCTFSSNSSSGIQIKANSVPNVFKNCKVFSPIASNAPTAPNVTIIGDSIMAGGATSAIPLGGYIFNMRGLGKITNIAIGGETSADGLARFDDELQLFNPTESVVIGYGANDIGYGFNINQTISNLDKMVNDTISRGLTPYILLVTPHTDPTRNSNVILFDTAINAHFVSRGVHVINTYDMIDSVPFNGIYDACVPSWYVDVIHPDSDAYKIIGPRIANSIIAAQYIHLTHLSGYTPMTFSGKDSSTYDSAWSWDFENDGKIDTTSKNTSHTYYVPGTYMVNLTVHNGNGNYSVTQPVTVTSPSFWMSNATAKANWISTWIQNIFVTGVIAK